jgi:Rad3-related DNA helicase
MSATLQPAHLRYIGLVDPSKYDFWEFESTFPTANRPFYYFPVAFMHYAMKESEKLRWVHGIDRIAEVHRGEKGLVHTVSFDRADYYANKTKLHGRRTMFGTPASRSYVHVPTSEIVAQFRLRSDAPVLVSPSLATGYDFPDDDARWQVVGKVPFPDKRGRLIQARTAVDPEYAPMLAMTQVVQAYGRIVRSMSDWGTTYMIDRTWETFYHKFKKFAPRWFQAVVKRVSSIPKGSAKLTARIAKANIERGSEGGDAR